MRNPRPRESLIRTPKPRPSSSVEAASIRGEADTHPKNPKPSGKLEQEQRSDRAAAAAAVRVVDEAT